jgi:hypothetical protein
MQPSIFPPTAAAFDTGNCGTANKVTYDAYDAYEGGSFFIAAYGWQTRMCTVFNDQRVADVNSYTVSVDLFADPDIKGFGFAYNVHDLNNFDFFMYRYDRGRNPK